MPNSNGNVYNVYANYVITSVFSVLLCCYCQMSKIAANTTHNCQPNNKKNIIIV